MFSDPIHLFAFADKMNKSQHTLFSTEIASTSIEKQNDWSFQNSIFSEIFRLLNKKVWNWWYKEVNLRNNFYLKRNLLIWCEMRSINNEYGSDFFACYKSFSFIRIQNNSKQQWKQKLRFPLDWRLFCFRCICISIKYIYYMMYKMY